ncbi:MAG: HupE/UreJ family protein [Bacteroidota bacterium]
MSDFQLYLQLGFEHILDPKAYDHILFVVALCAIYRIDQWRRVLVLVTAFTIGHSLTLALAALDIIRVNAEVIEFLIPITIIITGLFHVFKTEAATRNVRWNYAFALFFGLIHGLGFSNYLRALTMGDESIVQQLLAFNIGVELGQLVIVAIVLLISYIVMTVFKVKQREWILFVSGAVVGMATMLLLA